MKDKLTALFMRGNRAIPGDPVPLKTKNECICGKIDVKTMQQLLIESVVKLIQLYDFKMATPNVHLD